MANTFLRKTSRDIGTTATAIGGYTVGASTATTVIGLTCANTTSAAITVDVQHNDGSNDTYVVKGATVPAGGSLVVVGGDQKVVLEAGDSVKVTSSAATSCDVIMSILGDHIMGKSHDLATLKDDGGKFGSASDDVTFFGTSGTLLSTDTHISHNIYWGGSDWATINSAVPSSSMRLGGGSDNEFRFMNAAAGSNSMTTRLTIDASGRVTMPYQPYARASCSTVTSATQRIPLNSHNAYRGGMSIDNTNNRINVPVSGAYVMGYAYLGNYGSGATQIEIRINGTSEHGTRIQTTGNDNDNGSSQWIKELSANDYIEFWCIQDVRHMAIHPTTQCGHTY